MSKEAFEPKIAIVNTANLNNKGSMGRVEGIIKCLDGVSEEIVIIHRYFEQDQQTHVKQLKQKYPHVTFKEHPWFREKSSPLLTAIISFSRFCILASSYNILRLFKKKPKGELQSSDVIVDLNLIEPAEGVYLKMTIGAFFALMDTWHSKMAGKPVNVCSATIGPYNNFVLTSLARYVLNKVDLITLRENYSEKYLDKIRVNKPQIQVTADLAFLMDISLNKTSSLPKIVNDLSSDEIILGIAVSAMLHPALSESLYVQLIADLADFMIEKFDNPQIILITHTYQDSKITSLVYSKIKNKQKIRMLPSNLSATETKSVIGLCDLFICSRFHALVASTSLAVPSLGIVAYSKGKFHGIIGNTIGQENYLIDVPDDFDYDIFLSQLKSKVTSLWCSREEVKQDLIKKGSYAKSQALLNGQLIKELLNHKKL